MLIRPFIKNNYKTVNAFQGTKQVRETIFECGSALVIADDTKPIGIITVHDLATSNHNLVIDCLTDKPILTNEHLIPEVLSMMDEVHSDILLVYEKEELVGVVYKKDITDYLCRSLEQQKNLIHSLAHDLKNPLFNVLSITHLLAETEDKSESQELLMVAQQACNYATSIISDILFSDENRKDPLNKEMLSVSDLVKDCLDSFKITLRQKEIQLILETCETEMIADRVKLKRVFDNLISNAIKFTPHGGTISVMTEQDDSRLQVIIKDSGIGISTEMQPRIFDKFTNAKRSGTDGEGTTGLGMFITKQIVEQHVGKIRVESQEGQGTTFYLEFSNPINRE